ncbi:MAG: Bax inhibitor-1 family protein [Candidatus Kariarchaeaceae archaeon]|jgi:FtsH-binding integral membrane protein
MSYYQQQQQYYYPTYDLATMKQLVLEKLTYGLIIAAALAWAVVQLDAPIALIGLAFIVEIIAIIGYFFAKAENTIETLYYMFVGSSAVLLGFTLDSILASSAEGANIIGIAFGITALVVGGIYYYTSTRLPDTTVLQKYMLPLFLVFILVMILAMIGSVSMFFFSIFGAAIFSFYLYYDFARLMRGQLTSPARMAWSLYWDILLIFRYILMIVYHIMNDR